jgi:hypothetical protein
MLNMCKSTSEALAFMSEAKESGIGSLPPLRPPTNITHQIFAFRQCWMCLHGCFQRSLTKETRGYAE